MGHGSRASGVGSELLLGERDAKLKKLLAQAMLDNAMLKDFATKKRASLRRWMCETIA